ncbi:S8 family serine peptidase [Aquimarina spongiae]|uniref:Subtilase family protein n=1 Tax=Aquimarina spongiae TaxID=570521 RepID=A0A1M6DV08_9FLAO|nr:S8 family serine peptidase [Aquimarina spongiae]SHI76983.1 Subtilase family protein [Aquimarina spongiae]
MNLKSVVITVFYLLVISHSSCQETPKKSSNNHLISKEKKLSNEELQNWHHKDYENDTIPGVGLDRLYESGLLDKYPKGDEVIVAVIDTKVEIDHIDLKEHIWENKDEIANNGIDDDNNGFIDDKVGWDFLGNSNGKYVKFQSAEVVRVIKKYEQVFEGKDSTDIDKEELSNYKLYVKAKKQLPNDINKLKSSINYFKEWLKRHESASASIKQLTKKEEISVADLDKVLSSTNDSITNDHAKFLKSAKQNDRTEKMFKHYIQWYSDMLETTYHLDYKEREIVGDNLNKITDSIYGNHIVSGEVPFNHSIVVSGVIGSDRNNSLGAMGFSENIKIMPIVMVASGDEHDKDIAMAIRYAVNNGAKVINMSWGKQFSLHQNWVIDAIKYAESNNVLVVHGAGNDAVNTDKHLYFPNDYMDGPELVNNFIVVGASGYEVNENLVASFSNYGKNTVDVFAPGVKIYTTKENNNFGFSRGTSLAAPMVSGLAGLLLSYFPNLSAAELKKIIMESGTYFEIPVKINDDDNTQKEVSFTELSKSGRIINAYNAFLMASRLQTTN